MTRKTILLLVVVVALAIAAPTLAKHELTGDRINLLCGSDPACLTQTFPEGDPFYIMHGWGGGDADGRLNKYDFQLEIDGVYVTEDYRDKVITSKKPKVEAIYNVFLFPEGMTGTHVFTAHWLAPCKEMVDLGSHPGPCSNPNELIEVISWDVTVEFTP